MPDSKNPENSSDMARTSFNAIKQKESQRRLAALKRSERSAAALQMAHHQLDVRRKGNGFVAMKPKYRLDQFDRVLALRNRNNLPYLLIGGQAVNFWAGLYADREPALNELRPFTSEDIDFKGDTSH